jgi:hypothetical protein
MLTKCPDCAREVSTKAPACIHCGCPLGGAESVRILPIPPSAHSGTTGSRSRLKTFGVLLTLCGCAVFLFTAYDMWVSDNKERDWNEAAEARKEEGENLRKLIEISAQLAGEKAPKRDYADSTSERNPFSRSDSWTIWQCGVGGILVVGGVLLTLCSKGARVG